MSSSDMPQTPVREVMVSLDDALCLDVQDSVQEAMRKGLYSAPDGKLVLISEQSELVALTTAGKLRGQALPRTWHGPLKEWITSLPAPPEVTADTLVAELDFFVQDRGPPSKLPLQTRVSNEFFKFVFS